MHWPHLVKLHATEPVPPGDACGRRASETGRAVNVHAAAHRQRACDRQHDPRQAPPQALPIKVHNLRKRLLLKYFLAPLEMGFNHLACRDSILLAPFRNHAQIRSFACMRGK